MSANRQVQTTSPNAQTPEAQTTSEQSTASNNSEIANTTHDTEAQERARNLSIIADMLNRSSLNRKRRRQSSTHAEDAAAAATRSGVTSRGADAGAAAAASRPCIRELPDFSLPPQTVVSQLQPSTAGFSLFNTYPSNAGAAAAASDSSLELISSFGRVFSLLNTNAAALAYSAASAPSATASAPSAAASAPSAPQQMPVPDAMIFDAVARSRNADRQRRIEQEFHDASLNHRTHNNHPAAESSKSAKP